MANDLSDVNILITRQEQNGAELISKLSSYKANCIRLPLFAIQSMLNQVTSLDICSKLRRCALGVFVSRNAAELLLPHLDQNIPLQWACMGPETAQYLQQNGISQVIYPLHKPFDSSGLLQQLEFNNLNLSRQYIMLFSGEHGLAWLSEELRKRGAIVEVVSVYRRIMPSIDAHTVEKIFTSLPALDIIVITCVSSLVTLLQLTRNIGLGVYNIPLLVVSERIRKQAINMGFLKVYTANSMSDEDILSALLDWRAANK
jgi:uroporphyrinogen-III synthase